MLLQYRQDTFGTDHRHLRRTQVDKARIDLYLHPVVSRDHTSHIGTLRKTERLYWEGIRSSEFRLASIALLNTQCSRFDPVWQGQWVHCHKDTLHI